MKGKAWRIVLLAALLAAAAVVGFRGWRSVERYRLADRVCDAVSRGDLDTALDLSRIDFTTDLHALQVAECRASALIESGRKDEMVELLDGLIEDPRTAHWLPSPLHTAVVVESRRGQGRLPEAADLAHRGAIRYPDSFVLLYLEMQLRSQLETEDLVLEEILQRLRPDGPATRLMQLRIAERYLRREDWERAAELIGEQPPPDPKLDTLWHDLRLQTLGGLGRQAELHSTFADWLGEGGEVEVKKALYAMTLSRFGVEDGKQSTLDRLREVAEAADFPNPGLQRIVRVRYLFTLVVFGFHDEALAFYDLLEKELGEVPGLSREEILRSKSQRFLVEEGEAARLARGTIAFRVEEPHSGDRLLITPPPDAPVDGAYEKHEFASGAVEIRRAVSTFPVRWVLRNQEGTTRGSGTVWPVPGEVVKVVVERRLAEATVAPYVPSQPPADGRRRVFVVVLDCADWRLVQYGRTRGEMPVLEHLAHHGRRAVLNSQPAFTAVAIHSLVFPNQLGSTSFLELLHQIGTEIEALNAVGRNPVAALRWLLPGQEDLFSVIGSGAVATVNMLRAFGPLPGGRNAEIIGPHGESRLLTGFAGLRSATDDERQRYPLLFAPGTGEGPGQPTEMAADFDTLVALAQAGDIDLVLFRVASLDLMTHRYFYRISSSGQDDGKRVLYEVYRYMDARIGELFDALDRDDVLVVMSDHGIRTALEHDPRALFVAAGGDVPPGRTEGRPDLRGVGRMLAELFGVETAWPATGIEGWVAEMPGAPDGGATAAP